MNNPYLFTDPLLGNIYFEDLINYLSLLKKNNDIMIKRLVDILTNLDYSPKDISSILKEDISSSLQFLIDIYNDNL